MLKIDARDLKRLSKDLQTFAKKAIPHAARNALNDFAFAAREEWQGEIRRSFTLRNQYTVRSIRVEKASGIDLRSMTARTGSIASYMADQESGAAVRGKGKHKAIPAPAAAGHAAGAGKRTRLIRAGRRVSAIHIAKASLSGSSRKQRNAIALAMARRKGNQFALLERPAGGKGLFVLGGGKRKQTTKMVYDLSRSSVVVKPEPTLQRTLRAIEPRLARIQYDSMIAQLKRNKVFGY